MTPERFAKLKEALDRRQPDLTVLADGVHKSHNISAILRTCDAVGIQRIHAVSPDGDLPKHHMTAGGSKRWVDVRLHASSEHAIDTLRRDGWQLAIAASDSAALHYRDVDYTAKLAIVMGQELEGPSEVAKRAAHFAIQIPMYGLVESLNVSVATAIILFEAATQRRAAGLYEHCRIPRDEYERTLFEWAHPSIARRCRERRIPYPALSEDGDLAENPFASANR